MSFHFRRPLFIMLWNNNVYQWYCANDIYYPPTVAYLELMAQQEATKKKKIVQGNCHDDGQLLVNIKAQYSDCPKMVTKSGSTRNKSSRLSTIAKQHRSLEGFAFWYAQHAQYITGPAAKQLSVRESNETVIKNIVRSATNTRASLQLHAYKDSYYYFLYVCWWNLHAVSRCPFFRKASLTEVWNS